MVVSPPVNALLTPHPFCQLRNLDVSYNELISQADITRLSRFIPNVISSLPDDTDDSKSLLDDSDDEEDDNDDDDGNQ